ALRADAVRESEARDALRRLSPPPDDRARARPSAAAALPGRADDRARSAGRMGVWDLVAHLRAEGLGLILTTHYMDEAERLSDALTVLARGRVVAQGTAKTVLGDLVGEHVVVLDAAA